MAVRNAGLLVALAIVAASGACARPPMRGDRLAPSYGEALYLAHCMACHGATGAGDGPRAATLSVVPPDLREIAQRNGGSYPLGAVERIIAGRAAVSGHSREGMPVWGDLLLEPGDGYAVKTAEEKVTHLARYLATRQKAPRAK